MATEQQYNTMQQICMGRTAEGRGHAGREDPMIGQ
jgi:hypothetical protein